MLPLKYDSFSVANIYVAHVTFFALSFSAEELQVTFYLYVKLSLLNTFIPLLIVLPFRSCI